MKIFKNKWKEMYFTLSDGYKSLSTQLDYVTSCYEEFTANYTKLVDEKNKELETLKDLITKKDSELLERESDIRKLKTSKGGLTKENNKLKKLCEHQEETLEELAARVEDLKSDRYLKVSVKADRTKSHQKAKIKSGVRNSSVKKELKEINEMREKEND